MSEADRYDRRLDDLFDDLFDDLVRDVAHTSPPRSADRAIRGARRRQAVLAGAVAVVALAATGAALRLDSEGEAPPPASTTPSVPTPSPTTGAPLDAAALNAATAGWVSGWVRGGSPVLTDPPCVQARGLARPVTEDSLEFRHGDAQGVARTYLRFASASAARTAYDALSGQLTACGTASRPPVSRGEDRTQGYRVPSDGGATDVTVVLALTGDRLGLLTVAGVEAAPTARTVQRLGTALVLGLTAAR